MTGGQTARVNARVVRGEPFVSPRTPIDLTNCDREPIHLPGAIQPHGALLGVDEADGRIKQVSRNAAALLETDALGLTLDETLGPEAARAIREALDRGHARTGTSIITPAGDFEATVHRSGGLAIVELEPTTGEPTLTPAS